MLQIVFFILVITIACDKGISRYINEFFSYIKISHKKS